MAHVIAGLAGRWHFDWFFAKTAKYAQEEL